MKAWGAIHRTGLKQTPDASPTQAVLADLLQQAQQVLDRLPDSRAKAYETIRLALLTPLLNLRSQTAEADLISQCVSLNPPTNTN